MMRLSLQNDDILAMLDDILEKRDHEWWDKFYSDREKPIPFSKNIPDECLILYCTSNILKKGRALDIGCGNRRNSLYLAKQAFDVIGIDISDEAIKRAQESLIDCISTPNFKCQSIFEFEDKYHVKAPGVSVA